MKMKRSFKKFTLLLLTLFLSFSWFSYSPMAFYDVVQLVQDSSNTLKLPSHFRKTTDLTILKVEKNLNLTGLDSLNISGSAQFSENGLSFIKNSIGDNYSIVDIDLREESHGFINGVAASFENTLNNANKGLTLDQVINTENIQLDSIPLDKPITFYNKQNVTIVPEIVENELTLTKKNNISYIRIPVTDTQLPSDNMVDYFVECINKLPENSWIHFHCKAGIGRTTLFMIMYDIMENYNEVSLNDIITRQVLLSTINQNDANSFFTGDRYNFLNKFYNSYKESPAFNSNSTIPFIKNSICPKFLYVLSESNMSREEQTMIATLQGIIATKSDKQIYITTPSEPDYEIWLEDLKDNYNVDYKVVNDPWKLLKKFQKYLDGYILYSKLNPLSINNACTLASLTNGIAIDESLELKVKEYGVNNLIKDCKNTDKYWAYNNLWNSGLNHSTVLELSSDKTIPLRDYAIISKSLIFYEEDIQDDTFRNIIFNSMDDNGHCLGWGPDEHTNVTIASKSGVDVIAADWSYNLSVLSSFPSTPLKQKTNIAIPSENDVHYVTFIMSDGDNQQWLLGNNFSSKNWFGSKHRKTLNLGWSLSPSLYYLAPTVFKNYYQSVNSSKDVDRFIVPPSGNGYMYPSKYPSQKLDSYTKTLNNYMNQVDENYVLILDDNALQRTDLWDKYTCHSNIKGLFYLDYDKNNGYEGKMVFSNNKPVVSCRDLLWGGLEDETTLINNINERIKNGGTDIHNENAYTFVYVHVWSNTMDNVSDSIMKLNENPKVRIVPPDIFMELINENINNYQ